MSEQRGRSVLVDEAAIEADEVVTVETSLLHCVRVYPRMVEQEETVADVGKVSEGEGEDQGVKGREVVSKVVASLTLSPSFQGHIIC